jgi:enamine deaminase RidA (YjgF/YER057c/UK114 family)
MAKLVEEMRTSPVTAEGIKKRLKDLGIELPEVAKPVAAYVPAVRSGAWVFTSGQLPIVRGELMFKGKVGKDLSVEDAYQAARICCLNALAALESEARDLDNVERIVKVNGFVAGPPDFTQQPQVINGASELLAEIFAEAGQHARFAVGVSSLPLDAPVELELVATLKI